MRYLLSILKNSSKNFKKLMQSLQRKPGKTQKAETHPTVILNFFHCNSCQLIKTLLLMLSNYFCLYNFFSFFNKFPNNNKKTIFRAHIKSIAILSILIISITQGYSQNIGIEDWQLHLSFTKGNSVTEAENKIYCATTSGLISYNKEDNSIDRLSKITGLSDISVNAVKYDPINKILLIGYSNGNIDIIQNNNKTNIPDFKNKNMVGKKSIYGAIFISSNAYLPSGAGIIVLDLSKYEIKETYSNIGSNGNAVEVYDIAFDGTSLFAATSEGVLQASISNFNLIDYKSWYLHGPNDSLSNGTRKTIAFYDNKIYTSVNDSLFKYNGSKWEFVNIPANSNINYMANNYDKLIITSDSVVAIMNTTGSVTLINKSWWMQSPNKAIVDKDGWLWIADNGHGLVRFQNNTYNIAIPNGPYDDNIMSITIENDQTWVASGGIDNDWHNLWRLNGFYSYINYTWTSYNKHNGTAGLDTINFFDVTSIAISPVDQHVFASSFVYGVVEFSDNKFVQFFNPSNSSLQGTGDSADIYRVYDMKFDNNNNLWMTNLGVVNPLSVKKADNTWKSFNFGSSLGNNNYIGKILIDSYNQKWIITYDNGLLVFNDNNTIDETADDQYKILSTAEGNGNLPSLTILSFAEDLEGKVWIGTDAGVTVFYSPELIFSTSNFDAQKILVEQDGYAAYLLENEAVNTIAVDGANRKWVGTNNGVFLFNSDGTQVIHRFTEENSPLISNNIIDIAINHKTGEVFFGTEKGIISYRSTATKGEDVHKDVLVFPNPVKENYDGLIAIKGLVNNATVKITDVAGTLIYQTTALGGQAIWNGKNYNGEKARTGVYLIFSSNDSGSEAFVTKLLIIN